MIKETVQIKCMQNVVVHQTRFAGNEPWIDTYVAFIAGKEYWVEVEKIENNNLYYSVVAQNERGVEHHLKTWGESDIWFKDNFSFDRK